MAKRTLLQERAAELIEQHGSTRAAGRVLRLSGPYLYRLMTGEATEPAEAVLRKLKLRRVVRYERTDGVAVCLSLDGQPSHCVLWKCHEAKTCARGVGGMDGGQKNG